MTRLLPLLAVSALAGCAANTGGLDRLQPDRNAFRAVGIDPAWSLSADARIVTFAGDGIQLTEPATRASVSAGGRSLRSASVSVTSRMARCLLNGDASAYPETVTAVVNGRTYRGCGGPPLAGGTLEGSAWRVQSVRQQPLPPGSTLSFEDDRFRGRFGCNNVSGRYVVSGIVMSAGQIVSTKMACADMSAEQAAFEILGDVVTVQWQGADQLTLSNAKGAIVLVR